MYAKPETRGHSKHENLMPPEQFPPPGATHLISSAEKFTMVGMKFSLMMMERICFQSVVLSPSNRQMDSSASFTAAGGLAMDRTSTRCCFFMDFTAGRGGSTRGWGGKDAVSRGPQHSQTL